MSRSLVVAGTTLLLVLCLPAASAFELTLTGLDTPPGAVTAGTSTQINVGVELAQTAEQNIVCAQEGTITVTLTVSGAAPDIGLDASLAPTELMFTIPVGAHVGQVSPWPGGSQSTTLTVDVGEELPADHAEHPFTVGASYDGTAPETCQGDFNSASQTGTITVPLTPLETGGDTNATDDPANGGGDSEEGPAPGPMMVVGAVLLVALLRRR